MLDITYKCNCKWESTDPPVVTVLTPFYNRGHYLERVFKSVNAQSYRNFEYIIVDDGSEENNDSIVESFMNAVDFPVLYLKKKNGGVHTARNLAIQNSRGKYVVCIDSDDELVPDALKLMTDAWMEIPEDTRDEYFEIKFRCKDQNGNVVGSAFPESINSLPYDERVKVYESIKAEHIGIRRGDIMRANPWPEPENITFVTENVLWCTLRRRYKSYFSNEIVRVYYTNVENSLTNRDAKKKTIQNIRNLYWNVSYYLSNRDIFYGSNKVAEYFLDIVRFCVFDHIIFWKTGWHKTYLKGFINYAAVAIFWIPCIFPALVYAKRKMVSS